MQESGNQLTPVAKLKNNLLLFINSGSNFFIIDIFEFLRYINIYKTRIFKYTNGKTG